MVKICLKGTPDGKRRKLFFGGTRKNRVQRSCADLCCAPFPCANDEKHCCSCCYQKKKECLGSDKQDVVNALDKLHEKDNEFKASDSIVEVETMFKLRFEALPTLYEVGEDKDLYFMVMEFGSGGDARKQSEKKLFENRDYVAAKKKHDAAMAGEKEDKRHKVFNEKKLKQGWGIYDEEEAQRIAAEMMIGAAWMHESGYAHQDIKGENIFIFNGTPGDGAEKFKYKLGDLGLSIMFMESTSAENTGSEGGQLNPGETGSTASISSISKVNGTVTDSEGPTEGEGGATGTAADAPKELTDAEKAAKEKEEKEKAANGGSGEQSYLQFSEEDTNKSNVTDKKATAAVEREKKPKPAANSKKETAKTPAKPDPTAFTDMPSHNFDLAEALDSLASKKTNSLTVSQEVLDRFQTDYKIDAFDIITLAKGAGTPGWRPLESYKKLYWGGTVDVWAIGITVLELMVIGSDSFIQS